jgi:hypothetical protein
MKVILVAGAVALLAFSGCSGNDHDRDRDRDGDRVSERDDRDTRDRDERSDREPEPDTQSGNNSPDPAPGDGSERRIMGSWGIAGDCTRPVEFAHGILRLPNNVLKRYRITQPGTLELTNPDGRKETGSFELRGRALTVTSPDGRTMELTRCLAR